MPHLKRTPYIKKPNPEYTLGHAVPTNSRTACYDPRTNTYTRAACGKGVLLSQGIGVITGTPQTYTRAFSVAFSDGFA
jgi:hypothetical protein